MERRKSNVPAIIVAVFGVVLFLGLIAALILSATQCTAHQHTEEPIPGVAATCTEDGKTEGVQCSTCGKTLVEQEKIPALGHTFGEPEVEKEPTATEYGLATSTCTVCGAKHTEKLDPTGTATPEDSTDPSEDPTDPTEDPTEPSEDPTEPTEGTNKPGNNNGATGGNNNNNNKPGGTTSGTTGGTTGGGATPKPQKPIGYGIVTADVLNVRKGPGTNYGVASTLKELARVTIYAQKNGWLQIDGGWVSEKYVYVDGEDGPDGTIMGTVDGMNVNVRTGPGTQYPVKKQVNTGDRVEVLFFAQFDGKPWGCTKDGWICLDYVDPDGYEDEDECDHSKLKYEFDGTSHWKYCAVCENYISFDEHKLTNGVCTVCGFDSSVPTLDYYPSDDGTYYIVGGIGNTTGSTLDIPATHNGKPVKEIGEFAFGYEDTITSVVIPSSITVIGDNAFYDCENLTAITIPAGVTSIGSNPFVRCPKLTLTVASGNTKFEVKSNCLINKSTKTLITGLKGAVIPTDGSVEIIGAEAFMGQGAFTNGSIPSSVKEIGASAFSGTGLTSLTLPANLTTIGGGAFEATDITTVTIPAKVSSIGENPFANCGSLTEIKVASGNTAYTVSGKCLIEKSTKTLVTALKGAVIPADGSVTKIGDSSFYNLGITSLEIPASVTHIGNLAFCSNDNLTAVTIPASVQYIGSNAFGYCEKLTSITFADTTGWEISRYEASDRSAVTVTDPAANAEKLTDTHQFHYWFHE